jgi:hypothetical protein
MLLYIIGESNISMASGQRLEDTEVTSVDLNDANREDQEVASPVKDLQIA